MSISVAYNILSRSENKSILYDLLSELTSLLPKGNSFDSDIWDLIEWKQRPGRLRVFNVNFENISNPELNVVAKLFILHKRLVEKITSNTAKQYVVIFNALNYVVGHKSLLHISNLDFVETQKYLQDHYVYNSVYRHSNTLQMVGAWLNSKLFLRISFKNSLMNRYYHGRKSLDKNRHEKLINTEVISSLIAKNTDVDISDSDKYFLSIFTILVAAGFRINEMATLPVDCEVQGNGYAIRYFPEKTYKLGVRYIPEAMIPAVRKSIENIKIYTRLAREKAEERFLKSAVNWREVISNDEALQYYTRKFVYIWLDKKENQIFNNKGAWYNKESRYIDVVSAINECDGNKLQASKCLGIDRNTLYSLLKYQLAIEDNTLPSTIKSRGRNARNSWDTDKRIISFAAYEKYIGLSLNTNCRNKIRHIIYYAKNIQLMGDVFPCPEYNEKLEDNYSKTTAPVIKDDDGKPVLWPHEALLITLKYQNSHMRKSKEVEYSITNDSDISRWFNGNSRAHGTGNYEDSCFSRLGIYDPETGEIVKFTSHDIRHWLNTIYANGGMSEQMISLIFNRNINSNHIYDQTSDYVRAERLRDAIENNKIYGHICDTYHRLANESREIALQYLKANTLMATIMPHGLCSLNWSLNPCPSTLSCFASKHNSQKNICEFLHIDTESKHQINELKKIRQETSELLQVIPDSSSQYEHYKVIETNVYAIIQNCSCEEDS